VLSVTAPSCGRGGASTFTEPDDQGDEIMRNRTRCAALGITVWTQACTIYRPPPALAPLPLGRTVRVTAASPFALGPASLEPGPVLCRATAVGGIVLRTAGDTLVLGHSRDVSPAADGSVCPVGQPVSLVLGPTMEVMEERVDRGRTMAALLAVGAGVAGFVALGVSLTQPPSVP
jgi:hypothetical protein